MKKIDLVEVFKLRQKEHPLKRHLNAFPKGEEILKAKESNR